MGGGCTEGGRGGWAERGMKNRSRQRRGSGRLASQRLGWKTTEPESLWPKTRGSSRRTVLNVPEAGSVPRRGGAEGQAPAPHRGGAPQADPRRPPGPSSPALHAP